MIVCDANVLLCAYDRGSRFHAPCRTWLEAALNGRESLGLPWQSVLAFIRIATNPRAYERPMALDTACAIVSAWLARPQVQIPEPAARYWEILRALLQEARVTGPLVTDAALAAIALECGATLCTTDRDFRRFESLKLLDPTAESR